MIDRPSVKIADGIYQVTFPSLEVAMTAERFEEHSQGITAEITVYGKRPPLVGDLLKTRLNLLSGPTKRRTAKDLYDTHGSLDAKDWDAFIEMGSNALVDKFRSFDGMVASADKHRLDFIESLSMMTDFADWKNDLPCVEWLVPGLIPARAMVQISGAPKAGKSWLMLAMVKAFAEGGFFLSYRLPKIAPLWYFSETDPYTAKAQMDEMGFDPDPKKVMGKSITDLPSFGPDLFCEGLTAAFQEALRAEQPPKVIFIDTLGRWLRNARESGWNGYGSSIDVMEPLAQAAGYFKENDCTLVVVHHSRKGAGASASESSLGSQGIAGTFDSTILLQKTESERRKLFVESRFGIGDLGDQINFEWNGSQMVVTNLAADMEADIRAALENGADSTSAIRDTLEDEPTIRTVQRRLVAMVKNGDVLATGKGKNTRYTLAQK